MNSKHFLCMFCVMIVSFSGVFADIPGDKLVAYYPFNGNANDESGHGYHGVVYNSVLIADRFGNPDSAYHFRNEFDYIRVYHNDVKDLLGTSFTISLWFRIENYPSGHRNDFHFLRRGNHANYFLGVYYSIVYFAYSSDPPPDYVDNAILGTTEPALNEWQMYTAVYDREAHMTRLYLNGLLEGVNPKARDPHNPGSVPMEIGNWYGTRNWWHYMAYVGDLDDVLIYKRALSDEEILGLYYEGTAIEATIDIDPDTLNLKRKGKWLTCFIELPAEYDAEDIDESSVLLNGTVPAQQRPIGIGDRDGDGIKDVSLKFDMAQVALLLSTGEIELTITGQLFSGRSFEGIDTIRVINPGKK